MSKPYFNYVPSSIIGYQPQRGQISSYAGIFDAGPSIDVGLQEQISSLSGEITTLRSTFTEAQGTNSSSPNLIANGDFSQFTLGHKIILRAAPTASTDGFMLQTRAHPIADRWFLVSQFAGCSVSDLRLDVSRVGLTSGDDPKMSSTALQIDYISGTITSNYGTGTQNVSGRHGAMQAIECRLPNVRQFIDRSMNLCFWVYSNQIRKGFIRVERVYNHSRSSSTRPEPTGFEKVGLEEFSMSVGWNFISRPITFSPTLHPTMSSSIDEINNGLMIQVGTFYHCWDNTGIMTYGDLPSSGLQLKFAEMQLSPMAGMYTYPLNVDENLRTEPYVNRCSPIHPNDIISTATATVGTNTIALSTTKRDSVGNLTDFLLSYHSAMKRRPNRCIYRYWNISTQSVKTGFVFPMINKLASTTITSSDTNTVYNAFDPFDFRGLLLRTALYDSTSSWSYVSDLAAGTNDSGLSLGVNNPIQAVVGYLGSSTQFPFRVWTYNLTASKLSGSTRYLPGACSLQTNEYGYDMFGWFTFIVDEIDLGTDNFVELFQISATAALSSLPYIH